MYNKQQLVMMGLARELLSYEVGDRIDTISSYTKRFNASRGVVQEALNTLEEEKAIMRDKRGTLGTFLSNINYKKLWKFTLERIAGVSPLPYTKNMKELRQLYTMRWKRRISLFILLICKELKREYRVF